MKYVCMVMLLMAANVAQASDYTYVVVPGDNLSRIAARYGIRVQALASANNIWNPNHIYAGQVLTIPTGGYPPAQPPTYPPQTPGIVAYYTVRPGDTLTGIARRYGTTWPAISSYNGLYNPNRIWAGMRLQIPVY